MSVYHLPLAIALALKYGIDEQRRVGIFNPGKADELTRYYLGDYEEDHSNGNVKKIHYIAGGNGLASIYIEEKGVGTLYHTYTDYLGSLTALTDKDGHVVEHYAFDPWGNRRNPSKWEEKDSRTSWLTDRGYTMHEHLDGFALINMNGRVYDPVLGRFLSPDPQMQAPGNWLNYNRYTYGLNNPMLYTDPSGEYALIDDLIVMGVGGLINLGVNALQGNVNSWGEGIGYFVSGATAFEATIGAGAVAGMTGGAINGAGMTALSGGSFSDVIGGMTMGATIGSMTGAVGGAAFYGANTVLNNTWAIASKYLPTNTLAYMASSTASEISNNILTGQDAFSNLSYGINTGLIVPFALDAGTYSNTLRFAIHEKYIDAIEANPTRENPRTLATHTSIDKNGNLNMDSGLVSDVVKPGYYKKQYNYKLSFDKFPFRILRIYTGTKYIPKSSAFPYYDFQSISSIYVKNYTSYVLSIQNY